MNNQFFNEVLLPIIYRWNIFYKGQHKHKYFNIYIKSKNKTGVIQIKDNGTVDLIIRDSLNSKNFNFWTNFIADDKYKFIKLLSLFFDYLVLSNRTENITEIVYTRSIKRILIACSTGISSSYFAYSLNQVFNDYGIDFSVDGVAISDIHKYNKEYDIILISHIEKYDYEKYLKTSDNILMID